ncbi:MAG: hypothetical protein ACREHD_04595 [Pirellulales bacterium]
MNILFWILLGALAGFATPAAELDRTRPVQARVTAGNEAGPRPRNRRAGRTENAWRYVVYQGRWWYWSASERWSYFDGARWVKLDSLNQPLADRGKLLEVVPRPSKTLPRADNLRFRFGELPAPRSRAGSFDIESGTRVIGRNFAGSFEAGTASPHAVLTPPGEPSAATPNPYGPGSIYGPYGSTNPFRAGLYTGAGGSYGYGLGSQRAGTAGGYGKTTPHARRP